MVTQPTADRFSTTLRLPRSARSVGRARAAFRADAASWSLPAEDGDTATLLLSELLTNACRHARVPRDRYVEARWTLDRSGGLLRVEVSDADRRPPKPRRAGPDDESGRGLELLALLAGGWGVDPRPGGIGKTVWFELKLPDGRGVESP
ncbi:ATP-binding protein [Kitasatospora azatica]|uniref:ATP-binding protein n=1 Tax=Kitasatospora azatica TaxID=58347 RepID=UPI00068A2303|nr:ATP-binding protein [Kitasatospora azatica]